MKPRKSWTEKLANDNDLPKVVPIALRQQPKWGQGTLLVPAPREVDEVMRRVPKGKLITINEIRAALARKHRATIACPIVTGIAAWLASHAAEEQAAAGKKRTTPWWRTLKMEGALNPKYPGGLENHKKRLEAEGHVVVGHGQRWQVVDYKKKLVRPAESRSYNSPPCQGGVGEGEYL